jgi:ubiquinol-cytochrome c reductase iron-sulfur subunit
VAEANSDGASRRDFLYIGTAAFAGVGAAFAVWPLIDQMNPSADVRALATVKVDLSNINIGEGITIVWQGKPVFIRHRSEGEITEARAVPEGDLPDPATDESRAEKPEWLIMVGTCTHLGCIPLGQKGDFGGWFCPCHGSHYDTSGRIRKGPAPANLEIPPYEFLEDNLILIG